MIRKETFWKWDLKERRKMEAEQKRDEAKVVTKETCSIIPSKFMPMLRIINDLLLSF